MNEGGVGFLSMVAPLLLDGVRLDRKRLKTCCAGRMRTFDQALMSDCKDGWWGVHAKLRDQPIRDLYYLLLRSKS